MRMRPIVVLGFVVGLLIVVASGGFAQTVSTLVPNLSAADGLALDSAGNLYASLYTAPPQLGPVYKISPGQPPEVFLADQPGAAGMVVDPDGNLFVAIYNSGRVIRVTPEGATSYPASGLNGPVDVALDSVGNLYVAQWGSPVIVRVTPAGVQTAWATVAGYIAGSSLAVDGTDNVYCASYQNGRIYKITPAGSASFWKLGGDSGFGMIRIGAEDMYLVSIGGNRVYSTCLEDTCVSSPYAGTGVAGHQDGAADVAQFSGPLGLAIEQTGEGDRLYVAEHGNDDIRQIDPEATAGGIGEPVGPLTSNRLQPAFPNPFGSRTTFSFSLLHAENLRLTVHDAAGREVRVLHSGRGGAGLHQQEWDGRDDAGNFLANGVYLVRLETRGRIETGNVTLLR